MKTGGGEPAIEYRILTPRKERILQLMGGWEFIKGEGARELGPKHVISRNLFSTNITTQIIEMDAADEMTLVRT